MSADTVFDAEGQLEIGQPAPPFNLPGVDGKNHSLDEFRGEIKALVVAFWCNHCPYVIKSEDRMIDIANKYSSRGVGFVAISANDVVNYPQDSLEKMIQRSKAKGYPFYYLYNDDQEVARAYGAQVTPHIFVFDAEMKLRYCGAIDDNIENVKQAKVKYLEDALDAILAGKPGSIRNPKSRAVGCSVKWKRY